MNNTYEVHCSGDVENGFDHDYNIIESDNIQLYYSETRVWQEETRGRWAMSVTELKDGISILFDGNKKPITLNFSQEEQLLMVLLHRNTTKKQIKEAKIIKEIK